MKIGHALELADGHILLAGVRGDVLVGEDRTDGVPEHQRPYRPHGNDAGADVYLPYDCTLQPMAASMS